MYCVNCGVELADSEQKCPLCGTAVCYPMNLKRPAGEPPFPPPPEQHEEFNRNGVLFILTFLFLIPLSLCLICDGIINGRMVWSGYAAGAIALGYVLVVLPLWFRAPNPVIFVPVDFAAIAGYLLYINYACDGHWYLTLALPLIALTALITCAVVTLTHYLQRGYLYIFGGAFVAAGLSMLLLEFFVNMTFHLAPTFTWCFYPLCVLCLVGIMLLIIAVCPPLRESLHKKFFL